MLLRPCRFTLALLLSVACTVPTAQAYEDQLGVAFGAGFTHDDSVTGSPDGPRVAVIADYGLDDIWTVRGRIDYTLHPGTARRATTRSWSLQGDLLYAIDILEVVPYGGIGVALKAQFNRESSRWLPAVQGIAGLDFLLSRQFNLALEFNGQLLGTADGAVQLGVQVRYLIDD